MTAKRVAILISGRGSNMQALVEAAKAPGYPAEIVGVLSNKADAEGLAFAEAEGIPTAVRSLRNYPDKAAADRAIDEVLREWRADIVCLAGFMRILSAEFVEKWRGRMINIHPSLLPAYPGIETHARALADEVTEHGCSVHFVTPGVDEGPVIGQVVVPVEPDDTPKTLAARVLKAEHKLYPWALAQVARGEAKL